MIGKIFYRISPDFDRFLKNINSSITFFVVDLTEAEYIDSTNLGLLAKLYSISQELSGLSPMVISTQKSINEVLSSIGFHRIFNIVESWDSIPSHLEEMPLKEHSRAQLHQVMLQSHQDLAKLNRKNRELFKDVINFLEQDIKPENQSLT